jgi:hypothetical protein
MDSVRVACRLQCEGNKVEGEYELFAERDNAYIPYLRIIMRDIKSQSIR